MPQPNDLSRSLVALGQDSTIIVVEMSQSSWLVAGMLPGIERQPRKKLEPSAERLLGLLHRWRDEAVKAGRKDHADCAGLRSRPRWLLVGALASCAWGGGARDPSLECRGIARTSHCGTAARQCVGRCARQSLVRRQVAEAVGSSSHLTHR